MLVAALWHCTWGRGWEGAMAPAPLSTRFLSLPPLPTIKLGPSGAGSWVGGLVHTVGPCGSLQRPLLWGWESLLLPPQPPGALSIRGLRLYFPELEPWVARSALLPAVCPIYLCANVGPQGLLPTTLPAPFSATLSPALSVYLCVNVGPQGLLVVRLPAPFLPHSASLSPATATRVLSAPPTSLDECLFFISLVSVPLAIRFSVSSGCARRHSVSTYAAILVPTGSTSSYIMHQTPGSSSFVENTWQSSFRF